MTVDSVLTTDAFEYRVVCDVDCDVQKRFVNVRIPFNDNSVT